ncbi:MAG: hypothetical protein ACI8P0_003960, partial [Planctomycetaceae bacterium]
MGAEQRIFNLYELDGSDENYLLVKAERPAFPNWSQSAEDTAIDTVEAKFESIIATERDVLKFDSARQIGTWEGGLPEGDVFYSSESGVPLDVWFSLDTKYGRFFVFGIAESESVFWASLREL